jgi:transcriptional regulator with XRE-family HTH domain
MIGANIRKIRKQKKLTQERLARLSNISLNTLTKIESGFAKAPNIKTVVKIARSLGVSVDELIKNFYIS